MSTVTDTEPSVTRTGHPKLPPLDVEGVKEREALAVSTTLASIADLEKRLKKAVAIIDEADKVLAENDKPMKDMALSLALHEGARGISKVIGMHASGFYQLTVKALGDWPERPANWTPEVSDRAKARRIWWKREAKDVLPGIAEKVYAAKIRRRTAIVVRDEVALELVNTKQMLAQDAAEIMGRNASRISQLQKRHTGDAGTAKE